MTSLNRSLILINYLCHECNRTTDVLTANQTCNRCHSQFVEEITVPKDKQTAESKQELKDKIENSKDDKNECSICLQSLDQTEEKVIQLVCRHFFHKPCIKIWFKESSSCPLCRGIVDVPSFITPIKPMVRSNTLRQQTRSRSPISSRVNSLRNDSRRGTTRILRSNRPQPIDRRPRWVNN